MTNLYDLERNRLKVYGEMLKNDLAQNKKQKQLAKEQKVSQESLQLQKHIENTKIYNTHRRAEQRQLNKSLLEDNLMLSTFKKTMGVPHVYAEEGTSILESLQSMESQRLDRLKKELTNQANDNHIQQSNRKLIQERIRQIENIQEERHRERIKEMQAQSMRNYEQIKRKHQQDMALYEKHKQLLSENDHYRDQLEEFTKGNHGLLDRFNRNEYVQRRAQQIENQSEIKMQMEELQRRKSQELFEYKKSIGDLEHSMLKSVLVKPQRYEPRAYSYDLKSQMKEDTLKKMEESNSKKEKIEINNIFGGVHGNQRQRMLKFIDRRLGIDSYQTRNHLNLSTNTPLQTSSPLPTKTSHQANDPVTKLEQDISHNPNNQNPQMQEKQRGDLPKARTPRAHSRNSSSNSEYYRLPQHVFPEGYGADGNSTGQKSFRSYDVISGRSKVYKYE